MRVLVQNLFGRRAEWPKRRAVLAQGCRELEPDLVALPEAIVTSEYDQVAGLLGADFHLAHQQEREPGDGTDVEAGQGHSIASRWPLKQTWELDLHVTPRTNGFACGLIAAEPLVVDWDWPVRRIDYVSVRCGAHGGPTLGITACERIFDRPVDGVWASDHYGVCADLELPRR